MAGATRSGSLLLLKGLVFPQWRRRPALLLGDRLFLYPAPGSLAAAPEELRVEGVTSRPARGGRLVLRVAAQPSSPRRHVFLGFGSCWERDQWLEWLQGVSILFALWGGSMSLCNKVQCLPRSQVALTAHSLKWLEP